ncbi:MAG TPA: tyrosine-type recombinase/integrase [Chloroflexota bacterium]|nr:tyrosine-type recombinase/integrase [Chloroflexota bacterium]
MRPRTTSSAAGVSIPVAALEQYAKGWVTEAEYRHLSPSTTQWRRHVTGKLLWLLHHEQFETCGPDEIRQFIVYATKPQPGGRWGNSQQTSENRPETVRTYYERLRAFFRWLVEEGFEDENPMKTLKRPIVHHEQIQPFSETDLKALLAAAKQSKHALQDAAILLFLLDTGVRASELCNLRIRDLDLTGMRAIVLGKGNKHRAVYIGLATARAVRRYLKPLEQSPDSPVFITERKQAFTPSSLRQMMERLGEAAGLKGVRCSPHTMRHTAAVMFLRAGGHVFALKEMLGHTTLDMTMKYVALAQADVQAQHYQFSPVERLNLK